MSEHGGARQAKPFEHGKAARLDDPARFEYLPVDEVLAVLDAPPRSVVVDYGAGTGAYALPIAQRRPDLHIVALDVQPEMLALLRAKPAFAALGLEAVERVPDRLHGAVARVLGINVLHELRDDDLATIRRALSAEGRFVTIDWDAGVDRPAGPPAERVYRPDEARDRLERAGLRVVGERRFPYQYGLVAVAR